MYYTFSAYYEELNLGIGIIFVILLNNTIKNT